MVTDEGIIAACRAAAPALRVSGEVNALGVLLTLPCVETSCGARGEAGLFEAAYYRGGRYYNVAHVRQLVHRYESLASCSYGPFQILFVSAWEQGYRGHPWGLVDPAIAAPFVVELLNARVRDSARLLSFPDAWNTGRDGDGNLPRQSYLDLFTSHYAENLAHGA